MDMAMKLYDARQAAIREGRKIGRKMGRKRVVVTLANKWQKQGRDKQQIRTQLHDLFDDLLPASQID